MRPLVLLALLPLFLFPLRAGADEDRPARIDLSLDDVTLAVAVETLATLSKRTILLDPRLEAAGAPRRVTLRLRQVRWKQALELLAERVDCTVRERGDVYVLTRPLDRIQIELCEADVRTALLLLARYADQSIVISPEVRGTITLSLRNVSAKRALVAVAKTAGDYVVVGEGKVWRALGRGQEPGPASSLKDEKRVDSTDEVLRGRLVRFQPAQRGRPSFLFEHRVGGEWVELEVRLAKDPVVAALQTRVLRALPAGGALAIGVARTKGGTTLRHVVAGVPERASAKKRRR